ncbi:MAG: hypothetical protein KDB65_12450 [Calditrichaeota bacterium]|nr:hypothetical protein [Calditrichota bacterium]MCB9368164.1 hypothetical protein [Calditrichota bacterium]
MNRVVSCLICLFFAAQVFASQSPELRQAIGLFESKDFEGARRSAETILLSGRGGELEAALYLLVRINLATGQPERAGRGADRLLQAFPSGEYYEYARFARGESEFLLGNLSESRDDLQWCADSANDSRLSSRAQSILEERSEFDPKEYLFPQSKAATMRDVQGSEYRPKVRLLLAFPDVGDPAPDQLESAFKLAASHIDKYDVDVVRAGSAYSAVQTLDQTAKDGYDLLIFAGDEGSATSIAIANAEHDFPILKLTSTSRSLAPFSTGMVEFLASQESQAAHAARFAANDLEIRHGIMLTPTSDLGAAQKSGFERCEDFGLVLDAEVEYPAGASSIRPELYDVMSAPDRLDRGGELVETVLSRKEREKLLGPDGKGEISTRALAATSVGPEAFFFSVPGEQINNYCSQLGRIPDGMTLIGNSSWLDERSLLTQTTITEDMYVVVPLLPFADRYTELYESIKDELEFEVSPWELLGIDAADFVSAAFSRQFASGADFVDAAREVGNFSGAAVSVDISASGENSLARMLQFDGEEFHPVKK